MLTDDNREEEMLVVQTSTETGLEVVAVLANAVPWLGGPVAQILSGISTGRKLARVKEFVEGLAEDLHGFQSEASERYVKTEDFQDLFEATGKAVFGERTEEKRRLFRSLLTRAIMQPGTPYDDLARLLELLERLQEAHIRIIVALRQEPERAVGSLGSQIQTLTRRLPDIPRDKIMELVGELNDWRVIKLTGLNTMMTAHGAADLRHSIAPLGQRLVEYVLGG